MKCHFVVGQRVVCIAKGDWSRFKGSVAAWHGIDLLVPVAGEIYTIREIYASNTGGEIGLRFVEIRNPIHPLVGIEFGFPFWEFAPLEERKTDISIFQKMLKGKEVEVV